MKEDKVTLETPRNGASNDSEEPAAADASSLVRDATEAKPTAPASSPVNDLTQANESTTTGELTNLEKSSKSEGAEELPAWLSETTATPVIKILIGVNVAVFLGVLSTSVFQAVTANSGNYTLQGIIEPFIAIPSDNLLAWGANAAGATVLDHQYWRLITNTFLHTNLIHLGMNMYVMWDFNRMLERLYGSSKFTVIYLLSGLGSSICSLLFLDPANVSAGASGSIFGIFGATVAFFWAFRKDFPKKFFRMYQKMFFMFFIYCVISSQMFPGMDNAAHLGGFLVGLWTALCLLPSSAACRKWAPGNFLKLACLTLVMVAGLELDIRSNRDNPQVKGELEYQKAIKLLKKEKLDDAMVLLKAASTSMPNNAAVYADEALVLGKLKRYRESLDAATTALKLDPKDRKAHAAKGAAYRNLGEDNLAIQEYDHLIQTDPRSAIAYNNRGWSYIAEGKPELAITDSTKAIQLDGGNAAAYDTRGLALTIVHREEKALPDYAKYMKLKPKDGSVYYHRALAYLQLGKIDEAKRDLEVARKSDYQLEVWESKLLQELLKY
jgi:membrane associated rhomboid family serine protease/Flp pilus assembly protein TadD